MTVQIDGSFGEGGGQIIRTSLSLAAVTGKPLEIINIRAKRSRPGLQPQHLTAVRAAATLCAARMSGDATGSTLLRFEPQAPISAGAYRFDIGTAGAAPLVVQTVLLPLTTAAGESRVTVTGGTHVPHAPNAEYLETVYAPLLRQAGLDVSLSYAKAGFFPRGGGQIDVRIRGASRPEALEMTERGKLRSLRAYVVTSGLPETVGQRGAAAVERFMKGIGRQVAVEARDLPSPGTGAAVVVTAECEGGRAGFSGLGERGKPMEKVAEEPCEEFLRWWKSGAPCDEHLADQLVLPLALARGESRWETPQVTEHLRTVLWVAQQFLPLRYTLEERPDGTGAVTLQPA